MSIKFAMVVCVMLVSTVAQAEEVRYGLSPNAVTVQPEIGEAYAYSQRMGAGFTLLDAGGLKVADLRSNGLASRSGMERGDILLQAGGVWLDSLDDLETALDDNESGALNVLVRDVNSGRRVTVRVTLAQVGNPLYQWSTLGVSIEKTRQGQNIVSTVTPNSIGHKLGLRTGDVIVSINGVAVNDLSNINNATSGSFSMKYDQASTGMRVTAWWRTYGSSSDDE